MRLVTTLVVLSLAASTSGVTQTNTGEIGGVVRDESGGCARRDRGRHASGQWVRNRAGHTAGGQLLEDGVFRRLLGAKVMMTEAAHRSGSATLPSVYR